MAFCGDETAAIIGDIGTTASKLGFAGEDHPKCVVPSLVGSDEDGKGFEGETALLHRGVALPLESPLEGSRIVRWDLVEQIWQHAVEHTLNSKPEEHPLLVCCNTAEPDEARAKYCEVLFEKLRPPALFIARNAMLSAFSTGRHSALVVDVGGGSTTVAPVIEGYVMRKAVRQCTAAGGEALDAHLQKLVEQHLQRPIEPPCSFARRLPPQSAGASAAEQAQPSFVRWAQRQVVRDLKHATCRVWTEVEYNNAVAASYIPATYELPDGTNLTMGSERFVSPELLIHPRADADGSDAMETEGASGSSAAAAAAPSKAAYGVPELIKQSIGVTDVESRKHLLDHTLLTASGFFFPGIAARRRLTPAYLPFPQANVPTLPSLDVKTLQGSAHERARNYPSSQRQVPLLNAEQVRKAVRRLHRRLCAGFAWFFPAALDLQG